jgi:hypothetical protein
VTSFRLALVVVFLAAVALPVGVGSVAGGDSRISITEAEAREVVAEFFRTLNARRYEETCELLADGYYARRPGSSRRDCAIGLRIGFLWSQEIRWRITGVRIEGERATVETVADGAPGALMLTYAQGRLRVLDVTER